MSREGAPTSKWPTLEPPLPGSGGPKKSPTKSASLLVRRPGLPEVVVPIASGLVIGRSPAVADLVLDDDLVSRKHAQLHVDPRGYYRLEDLGSRNGIRFAERTVRRLNLVDGDVFFIGKTELAFSAHMPRLSAAEAESPPRVDTMMVDAAVEVPEPQPEPADDGMDGFDQLGWRPGGGGPSLSEPPRPTSGEGPAGDPEDLDDDPED